MVSEVGSGLLEVRVSVDEETGVVVGAGTEEVEDSEVTVVEVKSLLVVSTGVFVDEGTAVEVVAAGEVVLAPVELSEFAVLLSDGVVASDVTAGMAVVGFARVVWAAPPISGTTVACVVV